MTDAMMDLQSLVEKAPDAVPPSVQVDSPACCNCGCTDCQCPEPAATALPLPRINLANLLYQRGEVDAAARELTTVVEIDRDNFEAFMNAGAMLGQMQQYDKAATLFRRAIELDDTMAAAYSNLANALLGQEMSNPKLSRSERISLLSEAIHNQEKAIALDPRSSEYPARLTSMRQRHEQLRHNPTGFQ